MKTIQIPRPDDWHLHLRHGPALATTVPDASRYLGRALVMPNLPTPITTVQQALAYKDQIIHYRPIRSPFQPLMALYLTEDTTLDTVKAAAEHPDILSFKLYPAGVTTNSASGVRNLERCYPLLEEMEKLQITLCIHGEVSDPSIDIFDREACFIERHLTQLIKKFPALNIVLEHVTTKVGVDFITSAPNTVAATITAHHLWLNRNDLLVGGIKPHYYCLPVLKTEPDRQALIAAAISGSPKFFLGSDSAPHAQSHKQSTCGCAGIYTGLATLEYYAEMFDAAGALDKLANFASRFGAEFYKLPVNTDTLTLIQQPFTLPTAIPYLKDSIIPFRAGETLSWQVGL
jgi:dihydroorotase